MMQQLPSNVLAGRENIIRVACENLASELRNLSPVEFARFFQFGDGQAAYGKICEIVERNFPSGKMMFCCSGNVSVDWNSLPIVALDLEFSDPPVFAFFRLVLKGRANNVELHLISFEQDSSASGSDAMANTASLAAALRNAAVEVRP